MKRLVGIYYIDDAVDNIVWNYSLVPLSFLGKGAGGIGWKCVNCGTFCLNMFC